MTTQEQETAKTEIREIFSLQVLACEKGDLDALFQAMWNSPEFIAIMTDGRRWTTKGSRTLPPRFSRLPPR